jgi:predicted nucleic acid-binding protein
MKKSVLLDTGGLVAFINKREKQHPWAVEQWKKVIPPLFTCEAVITESCFLLQDVYEGEDAVMTLIDRQIIQMPFQISNESPSIRLLMKQYQNVPMSLADACLVRMSELIESSCVFTFDSDFRVYRRHKNEAIELIIPDDF